MTLLYMYFLKTKNLIKKTKKMKTITDSVLEMHRSLRVEVKIPHDEVDRLIVNRLISIRNAEGNGNTDTSFIDKTIRWISYRRIL